MMYNYDSQKNHVLKRYFLFIIIIIIIITTTVQAALIKYLFSGFLRFFLP